MKKIVLMMVVGLSLPLMSQQPLMTDSLRMMLDAVSEQQYTSQLSLSLQEAQEYAVQQNRTLQNASIDAKRAHAQRWQTIAAMLPQLDGSIGKTVMYDDEFNEKKISLDPSQPPMSMSPWTYGLTASVGLNGQAIVGALLNNLAIKMQDITYQQSESDLRANVVESYVAVLVMEDVVALMDSSLANMEKLAEQTDRMAAVGAIESTQADQLRVRVNQLRNTAMQNKRSTVLAYNALRVLLNVDAQTELVLTNQLHDVISPESALSVLFEGFDIHNNFNYQLLEKNVDLAKLNLHMAGWAYGPTVSAYYQYSYRDYGKDGGFTMMNSPHTVGFTLTMPLWSSGVRAAGVHDKRLALQQAKNTFSEMTENLNIQYQQLRYNLTNAYETYATENENISVAKRVFQNVSNKYNWGAASAIELTNASNDLITAQSSYVQAVLELVNAEVELNKFLNNK